MKLSINAKIIIYILIPAIITPLIAATIAFYFIFKDGVSTSVYKDLQSLVKLNSEYCASLAASGMTRDEILGNLRIIFNKKIVVGKKGFIFIVDPKGNMLVHKKVEGKNWSKKPHIKKIMTEKNGFHRYISPKTGTWKIAAYSYFPAGDFIIVASSFEDDFTREPIINMLISTSIIAGSLIIIGLLVSLFNLRRLFKRPMHEIVKRFKDVSEGEGDLTRTIEFKNMDEIGYVCHYYNEFIEKIKNVVADVMDLSDNLSGSAAELRDTIVNLSENTQSQAASSEEISASVEQVAASVDSIADNSKRQFTLIEALRTDLSGLDSIIKSVNEGVSSNKDSMDSIVGETTRGSESLGRLKETMNSIVNSSEKMTGILKIINDISDQINLLSLNASIEAARAGEHGRGFAVVADEISKLADETANSLKEIDTIIKGNNVEINQGLVHAEETIDIINRFVSTVGTISGLFNEISGNMEKVVSIEEKVKADASRLNEISHEIHTGTEQQSLAFNEITTSITSIAKLNQSNADMADGIAQSARELDNQARRMHDKVGFFKVK